MPLRSLCPKEAALRAVFNKQGPLVFRGLTLRCPRQDCRVERIELVDRLDALRLHLPLEQPQHDLVGRKIRDGEAVLLDRLHVFSPISTSSGTIPTARRNNKAAMQ
jgi:hypothetical protein